MEFSLEKEMIPIIIENIKEVLNLNTNSIALSQELHVNSRIIDIAFVEITNEDIINKSNPKVIKKLKKLTLSELDVLSIIINHKIISIQKLAKVVYSDYHKVKEKYINKFEKMNLIEKISKFRYKLVNEIKYCLGKIYALEAKLYDWKGVLEQAKDTKKFADYSFVAMDSAFLKNRRDIFTHFKENNIGLLEVMNNGKVKLKIKPDLINKKNENNYRFQQIKTYRDIMINENKWQII